MVLLDKHAFSYLKGSVSLDALKRIDVEWQLVTQLVATANGAIDLGPCECQLLHRFGLPCKHHLLRAAQTGEPLPRTLLHTRWWLHGPPVQLEHWEPSYAQQQVLVVSPPQRTLIASTHNLLEFRDTLPAEERSRLEARILQSHEALLAEAQEAAQLAELPLLQPDPVRKREWIKKKTHGKADARGLTGAEIAGRALKGKERKGGATRSVNTPCIAGPFHLPGPEAASSMSPTPQDLLASTAPARLQEEQAPSKRKRTVTARYTEARDAGLLH
jgi:hypothetical protein